MARPRLRKTRSGARDSDRPVGFADGTAAESGQQTRDGALAYFELVNRKGGVNRRKIS